MSYDLRISADDSYCEFTDLEPLKDFISSLPNIVSNGVDGYCYALDDPSTDRWMEIYLDVVDEEGDSIEEVDQKYAQINRIDLCIPYGRLRRESLEQDYVQTAIAISRFVGWPLTDLQTDQTWNP